MDPNIITLPANYPTPKFGFGQEVYLKDSENTHGKVIGLKCFHRGSWYSTEPAFWYYAVLIPHIGSQNEWYEEDELSAEPWPESEGE